MVKLFYSPIEDNTVFMVFFENSFLFCFSIEWTALVYRYLHYYRTWAIFNNFKASQSRIKKVITKNEVVIYTRVSGSQQEDNTSLESQKIQCAQYANRLNLDLKEYFEGTYESVKTDDRKQFQKRTSYVKKKRITFINVFSIDRFSGAGTSAITIVEELKKNGISTLSVIQPIDVETSIGMFFQNLNLLFSIYDNDQRRDKTIMETHQRLLNGYWKGKLYSDTKTLRKYWVYTI